MTKPDLLFELPDGRQILLGPPTREQMQEIMALDPRPGEKRSNRRLIEQVAAQTQILLRTAKFIATPAISAEAAPVALAELVGDLTFKECCEILQSCAAYYAGIHPAPMLKLQRFLAAVHSREK